MELSEARERIFNVALKYAKDLSLEDLEALTYGAEAIKTIEDMDRYNARCFDKPNYIITDANMKGENNDNK